MNAKLDVFLQRALIFIALTLMVLRAFNFIHSDIVNFVSNMIVGKSLMITSPGPSSGLSWLEGAMFSWIEGFVLAAITLIVGCVVLLFFPPRSYK